MTFAAIILPFFLIYLWISPLFPKEEYGLPCLLVKLSMAAGLSIGITSAVFFLSLFIVRPVSYPVIETTIMAGFTLTTIAIIRNRKPTLLSRTNLTINEGLPNIIKLLCFLVGLSLLFTVLIRYLNNPHGEWDAWAIWNMRARFVFRGGGTLATGFFPNIRMVTPRLPAFVTV